MKNIIPYILFVIATFIACNNEIKQVQEEKNTAFNKILKSDSFFVKLFSDNNKSLNKLIIEFSSDSLLIKQDFVIEGIISNAEMADLDNNGNKELYVYCNSVGSGSYGNVFSYRVKNNKFEQISFPYTTMNDSITNGYMGHDLFHIKDSLLIRVFPIYKENDINAKPTGGSRIVKYKLEGNSKSLVMVSFKDENSLN